MMTPSIYKESRALMPAFAATVVAMVLERLVLRGEVLEGFENFTLAAGCAFIGAGVFGEEYHYRTMPLLLSHPMSRRNVWLQKMQVLGVALAIVFGVFLASTSMHGGSIALIAFPILALFTGPGIGLGTRNTFMGALSLYAWPFTIWLAMMAIYAVVNWLSPDAGTKLATSFVNDPYPYLIVPGVIYAALFYWFSHRKFMRMEVVDVYGTQIGLPARLETRLGPMVARLIPGYTSSLASLFRKELQLQKPSYLVAGIVCVVAPIEALIWAIHHSEVMTGLLVLNIVACVLIIPLMATGMAVAEERSLGLLAWQRTLPPSALKQWLVKLTVAFGTSVLLGIVLPVVLINIWILLTEHKVAGIPVPHDSFTLIIAGYGTLAYLLVLSLVLFASSLSTSTFRAILLGLLLVCFAAVGTVWAVSNDLGHAISKTPEDTEIFKEHVPHSIMPAIPLDVWNERQKERQLANGQTFRTQELISVAGMTGFAVFLAGMLARLQLLAYRNFQNVQPTPRELWRQSGFIAVLFALFGLFLYLLTVLAYSAYLK